MEVRAFDKSEKRELRKLAQEAYSRELSEALRRLDEDFAAWKHSSIDAFQLSDLIHTFHQGPNRELYLDYTRMDPGSLVARALADGILVNDEVSAPLLEKLTARIAYYKEFCKEPEN